jgi:glycosyltransferase involved in cell wall biosynthesis
VISICIATYCKPRELELVLNSVFTQKVEREFEVIVVDDGSPEEDTSRVLRGFGGMVRSYRVARSNPVYRNPSVARNIAYRMAKGNVIVCQSDDVVHVGNVIDGLVEHLEPGTFTLANVWNTDERGRRVNCHGDWQELVGPTGRARRPIFFLGALHRDDLYRVGGNEERFTAPGREDVYFGKCLINGLKLKPKWLVSVVGHHIHHERPNNLSVMTRPSRQLYKRLAREGRWLSSGAPWPLD